MQVVEMVKRKILIRSERSTAILDALLSENACYGHFGNYFQARRASDSAACCCDAYSTAPCRHSARKSSSVVVGLASNQSASCEKARLHGQC